MSYREIVVKLGEATVEKVLAVFGQYQSGVLGMDAAVSVIATIVAKANARAVSLADMSLASTLMVQLRTPVVVTGASVPVTDPDRLAKGARTLLSLAEVTEDRIARYARSEPLEAASRAYSAAISKSPLVDGWTRGVRADGCQLCQWWSRDGRVWPKDHTMPTHKGCTCHQVPVTKGNQ